MSDASIALNRFGLGARPDSRIDGDPRAWLTAQLTGFEPRPAALAGLPARRDIAGQLADYLEQLRGLRQQNGGQALRARPAAMQTMPPAMTGADARQQTMSGGAAQPAPAAAANDPLAGLPQELRRYIRQEARSTYLTLVGARANAALTAQAPFVERLVHFWANHFAISIDKLQVIALGGLLEMEAIRPHVLGKFRDMLLAVEQHPAMLLFLDQAQSVGPNSPLLQRAAAFGRQRRAGLNENLGREILELHTLGVGSGYTQADVTELARALTGWTVAGLSRGARARYLGVEGTPGDFRFVPAIHEPGTRNILGKSYSAEGEAQARAVLTDLAAHPATARHIATKLARHFAGDTPPPALVQRLTRAYLASDGDLPSLYRILIAAPESWAPQPVKFKSPWEWSISSLRAVGTSELTGQQVAGLMNQLGQPVWRPGSPAGWDDIASAWAGPDALLRRVEAAERLAGRTADRIDARRLAAQILPGAVSPATAQAIERAESPGQGLALLLASPEFMRR
jgi:uncharacterized protein (DUF1800 family)